MAKFKKLIDDGQLSLFDVMKRVSEQQKAAAGSSDTPGRLNIDATLRAMISDALKRTPSSREQVAAEMSRLIGREIIKWQAQATQIY